ncbi:MAG: hypothetical protein A2Y12_04855 [Planctomycetes bacterium GWF2_42_9]|nr:MAG: hypothetical protein A2Y12_04855 [Planctomycetes bacterium GWF2_42_9]
MLRKLFSLVLVLVLLAGLSIAKIDFASKAYAADSNSCKDKDKAIDDGCKDGKGKCNDKCRAKDGTCKKSGKKCKQLDPNSSK